MCLNIQWSIKHTGVATMLFFALCAVLLFTGWCSSQDVPTVSTPSGKIVGYYKFSHEKKKYEAYEGVPYALPPTGELRFQPPVPVKPWTKELKANKIRTRCYEFDREEYSGYYSYSTGNYLRGDEDCLYINIYAPSDKQNKSLPVIFYIHGGAFQYGITEENEAHFILDRQVVYVTVNYRLGVLGFLSTEDDVVPGNMGLKDQSMALRWVKDNIKYFGGDPDRITLAGLSAGGASVHYHYLSPMSAGLFQNGISFSGTALDCWTQTENSRAKAFELGKIFGCSTSNTTVMLDCLKKVPVRNLTEAQEKFMPWKLNPFTPFGPVVEKNTKNPFIDRSPIEIINSGKVYDAPWVTGVVSEEGIYPVGEFSHNDTVLKDLNDNWNYAAPYLLDYYDTVPKSRHDAVSQKIRKHYFGDKPINKETLSILIHLVGDRIFSYDAEKAAKAQAKVNKSPVWFYYYNYRASSSLTPDGNANDIGVCHGDDVYLVIGNPYMDPTKSAKDLAMNRYLVDLWTTIAQKRVPDLDSHWPKVDPTKENLNYWYIGGPTDVKIKTDSNFAQKSFWNTIDFNENVIH